MYTHFQRNEKGELVRTTSSAANADADNGITIARFSLLPYESADAPEVAGTAALLEYHEQASTDERSLVMATLVHKIADSQVFFSRTELEEHLNVYLNAALCAPGTALN